MKRRFDGWARLVATAALGALLAAAPVTAQDGFDHDYDRYGDLLRSHLSGPRVDYAALVEHRQALDDVVEEFGGVSSATLESWSRPQRLAYWINAYNLFTLRAIVDHYPIEGSWLSLHPSDSIRQIDGVWDELLWRAGGREVTLDQIEHEIVRPTFTEPRIHFAVNCASLGCPPLAAEPYLPTRLDAQLDAAAVGYLASPHGLRVSGSTLMVTRIFDWYGEDFVEQFADQPAARRSDKERAILAVIARYGPPAAGTLATSDAASLGYLDYDWSLNDTATAPGGSQ